MPECIFDMFLCVVNESWKKARKCQMSQNSRNICSCVIGNTSWWWCVDWTEWGLKKMPENARCSFLTNYGGWYTNKKKPENARRHFLTCEHHAINVWTAWLHLVQHIWKKAIWHFLAFFWCEPVAHKFFKKYRSGIFWHFSWAHSNPIFWWC